MAAQQMTPSWKVGRLRPVTEADSDRRRKADATAAGSCFYSSIQPKDDWVHRLRTFSVHAGLSLTYKHFRNYV